jgi:hypothetical protein
MTPSSTVRCYSLPLTLGPVPGTLFHANRCSGDLWLHLRGDFCNDPQVPTANCFLCQESLRSSTASARKGDCPGLVRERQAIRELDTGIRVITMCSGCGHVPASCQWHVQYMFICVACHEMVGGMASCENQQRAFGWAVIKFSEQNNGEVGCGIQSWWP